MSHNQNVGSTYRSLGSFSSTRNLSPSSPKLRDNQDKITVFLSRNVERVVKVPVKKVLPNIVYEHRDVVKHKTEILQNVIENNIDKCKEYVVHKEVKKVVKVPKLHIEDKYIYNDIYVDEILEVEVPKVVVVPNIVEITEDRIIEKIVDQELPYYSPNLLKENVEMQFSLPMLKPVYEDVFFDVRLPRFVEVPVYQEIYENVNKGHVDITDIHILYTELNNFVEKGVDTYFSAENGGLVALSDMSKFMEGIQSTLVNLDYLVEENDHCVGKKVRDFDSYKNKRKSTKKTKKTTVTEDQYVEKSHNTNKDTKRPSAKQPMVEMKPIRKTTKPRNNTEDTTVPTIFGVKNKQVNEASEKTTASEKEMRFNEPPTPIDMSAEISKQVQ